MENKELKHLNKSIIFSKGLNEDIGGYLTIKVSDISNNSMIQFAKNHLYEYGDFKQIYIRPYFDVDIK